MKSDLNVLLINNSPFRDSYLLAMTSHANLAPCLIFFLTCFLFPAGLDHTGNPCLGLEKRSISPKLSGVCKKANGWLSAVFVIKHFACASYFLMPLVIVVCMPPSKTIPWENKRRLSRTKRLISKLR